MGDWIRKSRTIAHETPAADQYWTGGSVTHTSFPNWDMEQMITRNNPWRRRTLDSLPNVGGNFYKKTVKVDLNPFYVSDRHAVSGYSVGSVGFAVADSTSSTSLWQPDPLTWAGYDWTGMDPLGATAVSRCAPTNSHADLAVALGELKSEGLPKSSLISARDRGKSLTNHAADEYLGYQFGILPLVSDIKKTIKAVRRSGEILDQYRRDAGKLIRRRYEFPEERSTSIVTYPSLVYPRGLNSYSVRRSFTSTVTTVTTRKVWFSGAFTYASLAGKDASFIEQAGSKYREINHLLGLRVAPDVAWNLLPWSWLVDWKTNVGDVVHNISMFQTDGLVMAYGYVMQMDQTIRTTTMIGGELWNLPGSLVTAHPVSITTTVKMRRAANPFGFGITPGGLNDRQWSILAALGISKGSAHSLRYDAQN